MNLTSRIGGPGAREAAVPTVMVKVEVTALCAVVALATAEG
jgi:hypothetical protein